MLRLAAVLSAGLALLAAPVRAREAALADLTSGRYEVAIDGLLCRTCGKIISEEVAALPPVQSASVDFDREVLTVTIRPQKTLTASRLRRALKRAAKRVDLDTTFAIKSVVYKV